MTEPAIPSRLTRGRFWALLFAVVVVGAVLAWLLRGELQLERLVEREADLLRWRMNIIGQQLFWRARSTPWSRGCRFPVPRC